MRDHGFENSAMLVYNECRWAQYKPGKPANIINGQHVAADTPTSADGRGTAPLKHGRAAEPNEDRLLL